MVPQSLLDEHYYRLRPDIERELSGKPEDVIDLTAREQAKNYVIEEVLLDEELERQNIEIPQREINETFDQIMEMNGGEKVFRENYTKEDEAKIKAEIAQQKRKEIFLKRIDSEAKKPTEAAMQAYYNIHKSDFMQPDVFHASYILKIVLPDTDREKAEAAIHEAHERLKAGDDFVAVVKAYSDNTEHDGDMGWFPKGSALPMFDDALNNLSPGEFSEPFAFSLGWAIVKLHECKTGECMRFDIVKDDIEEKLFEMEKETAFRTLVDRLKASAKIEER